MRVHVGADHAAYELKNVIVEYLGELGHDAVDHGPFGYDPEDDYPRFVIPAAQAAGAEPESLGIVLGGSGNGEQIAANKVPGVRAALAYTTETAQLARQHNNAQVVAIGSRMTTEDDAKAIVKTFLETPWPDEPRHARRIELLSAFERDGRLPD